MKMKYILGMALLLFSATSFGQQMTWEEWETAAKTNIRLLPKYGNVEKNEGQKDADKVFIKSTLELHATAREASDDLIKVGFEYLYSDIKIAMYRFNQAYLIDPSNTDIYWGFGGVYMVLGQMEKAKEQYEEGLKVEPENTHLLTDYGTYFMAQYVGLMEIDEKKAKANLDEAIVYMKKSYELDPKDQNTLFKLSVLFFYKRDCDKSWKFYDECMALGGEPIPKGYVRNLMLGCERK